MSCGSTVWRMYYHCSGFKICGRYVFHVFRFHRNCIGTLWDKTRNRNKTRISPEIFENRRTQKIQFFMPRKRFSSEKLRYLVLNNRRKQIQEIASS
jgi:hypothetical protein